MDVSLPLLFCPLCRLKALTLFHSVAIKNLTRSYYHCPTCDLVSVPRQDHPDRETEKARYVAHNNDPNDPDYRAFLGRLWDEMEPRLAPCAKGLDFGSGPGPTLSLLGKESGFEVKIYDPFFSPDQSVLQSRYDFITCSETAEHFSDPAKEFNTFHRLLLPGGILGVMTGMLEDWKDFPEWHYHRDETHISFYSKRSMDWIASQYGWQVSFPKENVALFQKPGEQKGFRE